MPKTTISITLDEDISKLAKVKGINLSGTINALLRDFLRPKTSDLPEENIKVICGLCSAEITEGFKCPSTGLILCSKCQENYDMSRCPKDASGQHEHTKWTRETLKKS